MKRFMLLSLVMAVLAAGAAGCGNSGTLSFGYNAELAGNNYRIVQTAVQASDTGFAVFGIGADPRIVTAMDKIRAQAQLDGRPRALINVTLDEDVFNFAFIVKTKTYTVSCDVVEFTGPPGGQ